MKLLGRRELLAYMLVATLCWGFAAGKVAPDTFTQLVGMVIAFYFGARKEERR